MNPIYRLRVCQCGDTLCAGCDDGGSDEEFAAMFDVQQIHEDSPCLDTILHDIEMAVD